jgi:hypothetical protein
LVLPAAEVIIPPLAGVDLAGTIEEMVQGQSVTVMVVAEEMVYSLLAMVVT